MIRVTVERWPLGDSSRKYSLGYFDIINTGDHPSPVSKGNYTSRFFSRCGRPLSRCGIVTDWPRKSKPVLSLLKEILGAAGF
jgi:hypothetical protein